MQNYANESLLVAHLTEQYHDAEKSSKECIAYEYYNYNGTARFTDEFSHYVLPDSGLHMYWGRGLKRIISSQELTAEQCYHIITSDRFNWKKSPIPLPLCIVCDEGGLEYRMTLESDNDHLQINYYAKRQDRKMDWDYHFDRRCQYISLDSDHRREAYDKPVDPKISAESETLLEEFEKTCSRLSW